MRTRTTYVLFLILACTILFCLDRFELELDRRWQRARFSRATLDITRLFQHFFSQRLLAVKAVRLTTEAAPPGRLGPAFTAAAEELLDPIKGVQSAALLDSDLTPTATWSHKHAPAVPHLASNQAILAECVQRAAKTGRTAVSGGIAMAGEDFGFIAVTPLKDSQPAKFIAAGFRLWRPARELFRNDAPHAPFVFLRDSTGATLLSEPPPDFSGPRRSAPIAAGDSVWVLHVRPRSTGGGTAAMARIVTWGLGLVLILSFSLFYFALADKNAALADTNRSIEDQVTVVGDINDKLRHANRELDDFTYVVAHDLKEPLRGIEGLTHMFLEESADKLDDAEKEYLTFIRASGQRMRRLVDDLLHLSRITRHGYPFQQADFNELLREVLDSLHYSIKEKNAVINVQPHLPILPCDRVRVSELFQNLIANALKFTNGQPPFIEVGYRATGAEHLFWVKDNGIGIAADDQERIFHMFQRLDSGPDCEGNGVGLAICKRIIERHGGRIWVESKPGAGARFHFALCAQPPEHPTLQETQQEGASNG